MKILVYIDKYDGKITDLSLEVLSKAAALAGELNGKIIALVINPKENEAKQLIACGADTVIKAEEPLLKNFDLFFAVDVLAQTVQKYTPDCVFVGASVNGIDLAARVTARLQLGLIADCTDIIYEDGALKFVRPSFDGKLSSVITCSTTPAFATIAQGTFDKSAPDSSRHGEIISEHILVKPQNLITLEDITPNKSMASDLENASIVVACGVGIGSRENMSIVYDLAKSIGAAVAVTRPLVQNGWADKEMQVGVTGKTVSPKLYIALGISGAIQHIKGMENSALIIAVNTDPKAEIFNVAHYGIVGDMFEIVPMLKEKFSKLEKIV